MIEESESTAVAADERAVEGGVARAATAVRNFILHRSLVPGEQVRQEELAQLIGMSRGPLREALQVLASEGVLRYIRHRGYFVTQYTADEMRQIYLVRDLLESEILTSLPRATPEHLEALRSINAQLRGQNVNLSDVLELNTAFHHLLNSRSPYNLLLAEIAQISRMSIAYQSLSVNFLTNWESIADDHDELVLALERYELKVLVELARAHRNKTLNLLLPVLR